MGEGELRDLLSERLGRLEKIQTAANATLVEVLDTLRQMASVQLALRVGQEHLIEKTDMLADRVDRVAERVDRVAERVDRSTTAVTRGLTLRDEQMAAIAERIERIERQLGHEPRG